MPPQSIRARHPQLSSGPFERLTCPHRTIRANGFGMRPFVEPSTRSLLTPAIYASKVIPCLVRLFRPMQSDMAMNFHRPNSDVVSNRRVSGSRGGRDNELDSGGKPHSFSTNQKQPRYVRMPNSNKSRRELSRDRMRTLATVFLLIAPSAAFAADPMAPSDIQTTFSMRKRLPPLLRQVRNTK